MSLLEFPADNTEEYNKLLRTCYFIKHDEFEVAGSENFGKWKCKVCINDVFILQKTGSGLSSLIRHVKAKHLDHRDVCKTACTGTGPIQNHFSPTVSREATNIICWADI